VHTPTHQSDRVGDFRLERELGRGGMGIVYLAEDVRLGRWVAVKLITPDLAKDTDFRARFEREARIAAGLDHPNVVPLYTAGEEQGQLYLSMRYVDGTDLKTQLREHGRLDPRQAIEIVAQVGSALDAAHARGLVHRDVKPANVLLGRAQEGGFHAYLTDFGITKDSSAQTVGLTNTGEWVGTVDYISPEQLSGTSIDARSDVYSLGCVLYEAVSGQAPYQGADVHKMYAHMHEPPPSLEGEMAAWGPALDPVIQRAMAKDPADRYPSAGDLGRAAQSAAQGQLNAVPERTVASGEAATGIAPTVAAPPQTQALGPTQPAAYQPATLPTQPLAAGPQQPGAPRSRRGLWAALAAAGVLLVAAVVALAVVALSGDDTASKSSGGGASSGGRSGAGSSGGSEKGSSADSTFVSSTEDLLTRSKPAYDEVNDVFTRMQEVAGGQSDAIEPDEARTKLAEVITNRGSLRNKAAALTASSDLAREVRSDLVSAFDSALVDDRAIENCLKTGEATGPGKLFKSCLSSTRTASQTATNAKTTFRESYNRLRKSLGLAAVNPAF
jgi:hypothetical protein